MQTLLHKLCRALAVGILLTSTAVIPLSAHAQNNPIPVENFFKSSQISDVMFSPDGKNIAKRWFRLIGQRNPFLKWSLAGLRLSTAPLAAPRTGPERAARWVTWSIAYAASLSAGRCAK